MLTIIKEYSSIHIVPARMMCNTNFATSITMQLEVVKLQRSCREVAEKLQRSCREVAEKLQRSCSTIYILYWRLSPSPSIITSSSQKGRIGENFELCCSLHFFAVELKLLKIR